MVAFAVAMAAQKLMGRARRKECLEFWEGQCSGVAGGRDAKTRLAEATLEGVGGEALK